MHRLRGTYVDEIVGLSCGGPLTATEVPLRDIGALRFARTSNLTQTIASHGDGCVVPYPVRHRVIRSAVCADPYIGYQDYLAQSRFTTTWTAMEERGESASDTYIVVVDDGIGDHFELDVHARFPVADFNLGAHATSVAGLAASQSNALGLCGASPAAKLVDINLLARSFLSDAAEALAFDGEHQGWRAVYCNSWGPMDDGRCEGPGPLLDAAMREGVATGRGGRGSLYVFAAGNGGKEENMNDDGYANSPYTIAVAALQGRGSAYFSEWGAAITLSAPGYQLLTTSNQNSFTYFYGTSASAPLVAAAVSLLVGVNPRLGWRDVQEILMQSADLVGDADDFAHNAAHMRYSHVYGAGQLDAAMATALARAWIELPPRQTVSVRATPASPLPLLLALPVHAPLRVEHARVCVKIRHVGVDVGDGATIGAWLESPLGTRVYLTRPTTRVSIVVGCSYHDWCFSSVAHWGEGAAGVWTLFVEDASPAPQRLEEARLEVSGSEASYGASGCS